MGKSMIIGITAATLIQILLMPVLATEGANLTSGNESRMQGAHLNDVLVSPEEISPEDIVLDISPNATEYIEGAMSVNYEDFLDSGGAVRPASDLAKLLGDAGIRSNDSLIITGECLPCGGGPAPAFFSYWLLKYLGHENVKILQGDAEDWKAAGLNMSHKPTVKLRADYLYRIQADLMATYEFVAVGGSQIVDARPLRDYKIGSIPGAVNIPYDDILVDGSLKDEEELQEVFFGLQKERPVVVYTNIGIEAAITWFALEDLGYNARLYSWRDWLENQPQFGFTLTDIIADPNPVKSGQSVYITAILQQAASYSNGNSSDSRAKSGSDDQLTIKGCATCGFGSPQGFANLDRKNGSIQIGSFGKTPSSSGTNGQKADGTLGCTAVINAPDGSEVTRMSLLHTTGSKYMGIWNAEVDPGIYKISIVASLKGNAETFADVLKIEVVA